MAYISKIAIGNNTYDLKGYPTLIPCAYCSTAAGTAAKTAVCTDFTLTANTYLHVLIKNANTNNAKLTLNVNSTGAKNIWINGVVTKAGNSTLPAGTYIVYYDGSKYLFRTDGKLVTSDLIAGLGTAAAKDVPSSGDASSTQVVMGNDSRLTKVKQTNDTTSDALPLLIANSTTTPDTATARKNTNLTFSSKNHVLTVKNDKDYSTYPFVIDMSGRTAVTAANAGTDVKVLQTRANYAYDYTSSGTHYTGTKVFDAYPISMIANGNDKDGYNSGVRLGSHNGTTIVGAGESSQTFAKAFSAYNNENLYLTCDGALYIYTGLENDSSKYKGNGKINNSDSTASDYSSGNSNTYVTFSAYGNEILNANKQPTGIYRQGDLYLELGNNIATGTQGNSRGNIRLFSNNANYLRIMTADNLSYNNKIIRFPDPGNSNKNIQYQDTISSNDITTGTQTASKTVRADYLKTGINQLISNALAWHLVEASTSTPSYVTIPTTTPWWDVKVNVILTDYSLTVPLFFTHYDVSNTTYGSCDMRGGWQQDSSNGAVVSVKGEISGNNYKFTVTRCIVNRVNANYKLILYYR